MRRVVLLCLALWATDAHAQAQREVSIKLSEQRLSVLARAVQEANLPLRDTLPLWNDIVRQVTEQQSAPQSPPPPAEKHD